jgi:hypothetical protein
MPVIAVVMVWADTDFGTDLESLNFWRSRLLTILAKDRALVVRKDVSPLERSSSLVICSLHFVHVGGSFVLLAGTCISNWLNTSRMAAWAFLKFFFFVITSHLPFLTVVLERSTLSMNSYASKWGRR